jgi:UDP-xylose/UDP-N-acetylglucosamine transporter B4
MILGIVILKKRYSFREYFSIFMISVGICMCTLASAKEMRQKASGSSSSSSLDNGPVQKIAREIFAGSLRPAQQQQQESVATDELAASSLEFFWWIVGIMILTMTLFFSALMGIIQESLCKEYGKHPDESMYYNVSIFFIFHFYLDSVNF